MHIAVLGGRFDPPHVGHYFIAKQTLEIRSDIKKLLMVPVAAHQWKPTEASSRDRLAMLEPFKENGIEISDIEIKRGGISYTIDTIRQIKTKIGADIFWIIGSDILSEFDQWEKRGELTNLATFLVFPRDPYQLPKKLPKGFELVASKELVTTNLSSTMIRDRVKRGASIRYLVPETTERYIKEHDLYR